VTTTGPGGGGMTNPRKWQFILPAGNVVLATCLLILGHYQQRTLSSKSYLTAAGSEWIPTPPPHLAPGTQVAYAINFPALMVARPLKAVGQAPLVGGFVFAIVILWYVIGRMVDSGVPRPSHKSMTIAALSLVGFLAAAVGVWCAWRAIGMHYVIPPLGALLWSLALGAYSLSVLRSAALAPG
jgi:hypothetical protein